MGKSPDGPLVLFATEWVPLYLTLGVHAQCLAVFICLYTLYLRVGIKYTYLNLIFALLCRLYKWSECTCTNESGAQHCMSIRLVYAALSLTDALLQVLLGCICELYCTCSSSMYLFSVSVLMCPTYLLCYGALVPGRWIGGRGFFLTMMVMVICWRKLTLLVGWSVGWRRVG